MDDYGKAQTALTTPAPSRCPYSATESKPRNETQAQTEPGKITWKPRCFSLSRKACDLIKTNGVIQKAGSTREDKFLI